MLLSVDHVVAIEDFVRCQSPTGRMSSVSPDLPPPLELRLTSERLDIEPLPGGISPTWIGTAVSDRIDAIGLCLPAGRGVYVGAMVDRAARSDMFVVDEGLVVFDRAPSAQLVADLGLRRLGRPTRPPSVGTDLYWLDRWLAAVATAAWALDPGGRRATLDLVTVAACHPAVEDHELIGLDRAGVQSFVVERHREHCRAADWSCVRLDATVDERHPLHRWAHVLDDGGFSRLVGVVGVPVGALIDELVGGCSPFALELMGAVAADVVARHTVG